MSKAFTRDENDGGEIPELPSRISALPFGATNYITRAGADRLREELAELSERKRPELMTRVAADTEAKRQLALVDQRIAQIAESLESAQVIAHDAGRADRVTFGATVMVRDDLGEESRYRIVGVDEAGDDDVAISWISPIARALINRRAGERVAIQTPAGKRTLEVRAIEYAG